MAAPAGMLASDSCHAPGFRWASPAGDEDFSLLIDVVVDWQYFELDFFQETAEPESPAVEAACTDYVYDDELPIYVCSQGFSVEMFQEALGLNADGYFGPGTEAVVRNYQSQQGLPVTGVIDAATWSILGVTEVAPFPDSNGDGVIDGSEFPAS